MTRWCLASRRPPAAGSRVFVIGLAVAGILDPAHVLPQGLPDPATEPEFLDEVVVTARKTEESVQDIPMSVQVLTSDLLDQVDATHLFDLQFNVPGLVVNNLGLNGAGFSLRAVSNQGGSGLSVASHWNGVYLGTSNLAITRLFDLDRIEVLKGPQGTLYGRNSTGGLVNFIPRSPTENFEAGMEVAQSSFDTTRVQGHVNVPVGSSAFRLAGVVSEGNGYIRNSVDDRRFAERDFEGVRASFRTDPTQRLRVEVMAQRVVDDGADGELWLPRPDYLPDPSDIRLTTVTLADPFLETASDNASIEIEYDLGAATLHSITGYARNKVRDVDDCAGLPILSGCVRSALPSRHEQFSQEVRLVSPPGETVDWIIGAYYYDDDAWRNYYELKPVIDPQPTTDSVWTSAESVVAVFGQATWQFRDGWSATGGLRLNREEQRLSTIGTGTEDSPTLVQSAESADNASWRVDLQYSVSDALLLYGGVSTGSKSGGITMRAGGIPDPFDPEHLTAYEVGIKSEWPDRRTRLNAAAFYYDFRDLQVNTFTLTDDDLIFETDNAAKAEIYGLDAEFVLQLADRLAVSGGVVWLPKRDFVEYRNDQTGDTLSGNNLVRAPEWTSTTALEYQQPLRGGATFAARIEYNFRSGFFYTTDNDALFSHDAFGLLNLYLDYAPAGGRWYAFAVGRNLGDEDYFNQVFIQASPGYPATWEAGFGLRF